MTLRSFRFLSLLLVCFSCSLLRVSSASAQRAPLLLMLDPAFVAREEAGPPEHAPGAGAGPRIHGVQLEAGTLQAPDPELWRQQQRARLLVGVGAGLLVSAVTVATIMAPLGNCRPYGRVVVSPITAAVVGAVSLSVLIPGLVHRAHGSHEGPYAATPKQRRRVWGAALGTMFLSGAVLSTLAAFEAISECSS